MEQTVSFYIGTEPNDHPDLEVVARSSLAFAAALKEATRLLEPLTDVRVELESTGDGSLFVNSIIKRIRNRETRIAVLAAAAYFLIEHVGGFALDRALEHVFKTETDLQLSDEDIAKITKSVELIIANKAVQEHQRQIFQEVERDPVIKRIGVSGRKNERPPNPVERTEFAVRSRAAQVVTPEEIPKRVVTTNEYISLNSTRLAAGAAELAVRFSIWTPERCNAR